MVMETRVMETAEAVMETAEAEMAAAAAATATVERLKAMAAVLERVVVGACPWPCPRTCCLSWGPTHIPALTHTWWHS